MAKVLQLRRGTSAQHENFIGMNGEVTVDTNVTTICVHDGATPGGVEMARADLANVDKSVIGDIIGEVVGDTGNSGGGTFDINSVGDEFWTPLFNKYNIRGERFSASLACNIITAPYMEYIFNIDAVDFDALSGAADAVLVCQSSQAGYAPGDVVYAFGIGTRANPRPHVFADANGVRARLMINNEAIWVSHKTNGTPVNINNDNWKIVFRVWY